MMSGFEETLATHQFVWDTVAKQFSDVYGKYKDQVYTELLWGDELEYFFISIDDPREKVTLSNIAESVLKQTKAFSENGLGTFHAVQEGCSFMLEIIPRQPYSGNLNDLCLVEDNMTKRREVLQGFLPEKVSLLTLPVFPRFCCELPDANFVERELVSQTIYYKQILNRIKSRAGDAFAINVPVFQDTNSPVAAKNQASTAKCESISDQVFANSPVFSLASTSVQVTIQANDLEDAKYLHDQLSALCPVLIALTAGAPIFRGRLLETDSRVLILSHGMDDRPTKERQPLLSQDGDTRHQGPRYGCVNWFISKDGQSFNDTKNAYNEDVYRKLLNDGIEEAVAMHVAILCTRDPLYHWESPVENSTEYYDRLNGCTWPILRFKIPQADGTIGWRLEIRPMGSQLTDFENAAFAVFVYLLSRALREFSPNLLIPISEVQENYDKAGSRDAVRKEKFCFPQFGKDCVKTNYLNYMTVDEIVNGTKLFCGLVPLIKQYLDKHLQCVETKKKVEKYLILISRTASGQRPTVARRIREFVFRHPEYKQDSVVSEKIQYDLIKSFKQN